MSEILTVRLNTGEDIIGGFIEADDVFVVTKPIQMFAAPDPSTGKMNMQFMDFMPFAVNHSIIKTSITVIGVPQEELLNTYKQFVGEIIIPEKKIILG